MQLGMFGADHAHQAAQARLVQVRLIGGQDRRS